MNGIINLLKPPNVSSNTAVNIVKYIAGAKKAGHTGTLDPAAAGVLAVAINGATKYCDMLMATKKKYICEIVFGKETDTQDSMGKVTATNDKIVTLSEVNSALSKFTGKITQQTPMYSAAKHNGVPLYKLARKGKETPVKLREVEIYSITTLCELEKNKFLLDIECSKGTYIRTLCADLGKKLDTCAYMAFLLRTATSGLQIENSYTFSELRQFAQNNEIEKIILPIEEFIEQKEHEDISK